MIDIATFRTHWGTVAKIAIWMTGLIGAFLMTPPNLWEGAPNHADMLHFTQFVLAVLVGLFFLPNRPSRRKAKVWRLVSIAALVAAVGMFFTYQFLVPSWTVEYDNKGPTIIGEGYPPKAAEFKNAHPEFTDEDLVMSVAGHTEQIWPKGQLVFRYMVFGLLYAAAMLAFSVAAMAMIEFLRARNPDLPKEEPQADAAQ